jgi:hypothetical protein
MHLAPIGDAVRMLVYNLQILFRGFFFLFAAYRLLTQNDSARQQAMRFTKENKNCAPNYRVLPNHEDIA